MTRKARSPARLSGLTALIANGKWAIRGDQLRDIVTGFGVYLRGASAGETLLAEVREARARHAEAITAAQEQAPGVAVLGLHGTIFPRGSLMVDLCGAIDPHTFAAQVREAAQDPGVASIVLDVDSGGGAVAGVDVAAQAVREAAATKRVTAVANTLMCSAAYWIACGASEIVVTPAAEVGSIGVIGTHTDETAALEGEGLKVTYVRSAERKALGQPAEAMNGVVLDQWQSEVDRLRDAFVADIALGRDVSVATARKWATGDVWFGQEAMDQGLVDSVGNLAGVLADHLAAASPPPSSPVRPVKGADATPQEGPVLLELKDRTGKTHALDTDAENAQARAQATFTAVESAAYDAGGQAQQEAVASALGVEPGALTPAALATLRAQAADGAAYRADLEGQVSRLAVTVYGAENTAALARVGRLAKAATVEDLRGLVDDLTAQQASRFPGGRLSAGDLGAPPTEQKDDRPSPKTPARAFDF